ncbi:hypothetical protein BDN72DRAFT_754340 [Pluteus cervinus]|uniref:Uncharacterized protein n=1 Tax=Pluteus cervinus TaxID=181527 RepID=A0ACD3BGH5_9AGAR|nr:hypothetical protein BDN72DRAFT_754340 [Pluteus cervinus]
MSSPNTRTYAVGIGLLFIVVFLWTASNFVTQALFDYGFNKPFLVTYLNTSAFTWYLVPYAIRRLIKTERSGRAGYLRLSDSPEDAGTLVSDVSPRPYLTRPIETINDRLTDRETAKLALTFCMLWFIANWTVNASLGYTSVASATILSTTSGFFTLGIGRIFNVEKLSLAKIAAVCMSFGGVILVSTSDSTSANSPLSPSPTMILPEVPRALWGDFLALLSALFYALYVTLLKVQIDDESRVDMQLFFGFVGIFNLVLLWPFIIVLHIFGIESFEYPNTSKQLAAVFMNMFITFSSDYLYVVAMLKTTPLVATVSLSLTIPLAVLGDIFLGKWATVKVMFGAVLVVVSFFVVGWYDSSTKEETLIQEEQQPIGSSID